MRNDEVSFGCVRFLLLFAVCLAVPAVAQDAMPEAVPTLSFERVFASPALDGPAPRQVKLSPDGRYLTLLRNRVEDRDRYDLWGYDIDTREWRDAGGLAGAGIRARTLGRREDAARNARASAASRALSAISGRATAAACWCRLDGDLYLARLDGTVTQLTDTEGTELNPKLSSKGGFRQLRARPAAVGRPGWR